MSDEKISVSIEVEDKFTSAFSKMNDSLKTMQDNLSKAKEQALKVTNSMGKFTEGVGQAAAAFAGFSVIKSMVTNFQSAEMAQNKLNKAFENSKGGIGLTKKELESLGKTLEDKTLFGGEAIASVQSKLIAFRNIGGDSFKRATELALDFASATGQDASGAATILGKALSNPIEGLGALKKAGMDFNFEQEQMIEKMVRSGDIAGAQNVILKELETVYKGQAEAQTKGAGAIALMTHKFSQLSEQIGGVLFSYLEPLIKFINDSAIPFMQKFGTEIANLAIALGAVVVGINGVSLAMSLLTKSNAILLGISLAVWGIIEAFQNWDAVSEWIGIGLQKLKVILLQIVKIMSNFVPVLMPFRDALDKMIVDAKKKVGELEKEKADKAEARRKEQLQKETEAADKEAKEKLAAETKFQDMLKKLNDTNRKDKKLKTDKEVEDEFQKKLNQYNDLSQEDIKFLREEDKRAKEQKTKNLKLQRQAYNMLSKEDKEYLDEKAQFEMKEENKQFKKDQQLMKRKMKLTEKHGSEYAEHIIGQEQKIADEKEAMDNKKKDIELNIGNARFEAAKDFFGQMSQLQSIKSKEMFEIGKAAAIGSAIINTYEGITKTMASYPFPISAAMAAAQAALGFAQVSQISSQSPAFEEGGIVPGNSYTGDQVQARVNSGEMILNQRQQKNMFDALDKGTSGSSSTQINYVTNVKMYGNGDKTLKKMVEKTIQSTEKRKLQKQQFVKGRFAT